MPARPPVAIVAPGDDPPQIQNSPQLERLKPYGQVIVHTDRPKTLDERIARAVLAVYGNSVAPDFPKIAGQHYDYLLKALNDYKSGARKSPIMAPLVANLSQRDIEDLAAWYSSQSGLVMKH